MCNSIKTKNISRILDANINRLKEGLRVAEEIVRFILKDKVLTKKFKTSRHRIDKTAEKLFGVNNLIRQRNIFLDAGRKINSYELKRRGYRDIFFANMQRAKESARVLEEFAKLYSSQVALAFKRIRYTLYNLEYKAVNKF